MIAEMESVQLGLILKGSTVMVDIPQRLIAQKMGYSENHVSKLIRSGRIGPEFFARYYRALGAVEEAMRIKLLNSHSKTVGES